MSVPPHPLNFPSLEDTEEFDLHREGNFPDFVEEDRPLVGHFKAPLAAGDGTGKGTPLVAEEFGFQKRFRKGSAMDGHKGFLRPRRGVVDGLGEDLLPRSRLTQEQDTRLRGGNQPDLVVDTGHFRRLANHPLDAKALVDLLAQGLVLPQERLVPGGLLHLQAQFLQIDRFGQVIKGPFLEGLHGVFNRTMGGEHHDGGGRIQGQGVAQHPHPVQTVHLEVGDHHVHRLVIEDTDGLLAGCGGQHIVIELPEGHLKARQDVFLVVNQQ